MDVWIQARKLHLDSRANGLTSQDADAIWSCA